MKHLTRHRHREPTREDFESVMQLINSMNSTQRAALARIFQSSAAHYEALTTTATGTRITSDGSLLSVIPGGAA